MIIWTYTNIKSQGHSLTLVQGHSDATFSNFFFLETAWPIEAKFYVVPSWDGRMKGYTTGRSHMTKMAVVPIYGKNLQKISGTKRPITLKLGMQHRVLEYYQVCSNDDPGLTWSYFTARSLMLLYGKMVEQWFFRKCCSLWCQSW